MIALAIALAMSSASAAQITPLEHPVMGPKTVCLKYSSFQLAEGESIRGFGGGIETMVLEIVGPSGSYTLAESEIWRDGARNRRVASYGRTSVYSVRDGHAVRYAIYGPASFANGSERLLVRLESDRFDGTRTDAAVYRRVTVGDPAQLHCQQRFHYGWEDMLPESKETK
jgi:hypothetical protein